MKLAKGDIWTNNAIDFGHEVRRGSILVLCCGHSSSENAIAISASSENMSIT
jgi:hypothetical protein